MRWFFPVPKSPESQAYAEKKTKNDLKTYAKKKKNMKTEQKKKTKTEKNVNQSTNA